MQENSISSSIPVDWMQAGALPSLEHLDLSYTQIDEIPAPALFQAHALQNIKYLGLAGCELTGRLPELAREPGEKEHRLDPPRLVHL